MCSRKEACGPSSVRIPVIVTWTHGPTTRTWATHADESFSGDEIQVIVGKAEKIGRGLAKAAGE